MLANTSVTLVLVPFNGNSLSVSRWLWLSAPQFYFLAVGGTAYLVTCAWFKFGAFGTEPAREVGARNHAFIAGFDVYDEWTYSVVGLYIHWSLKTPEKQNTKFDITTTSQNSYSITIAMPFAIQFTQNIASCACGGNAGNVFPVTAG